MFPVQTNKILIGGIRLFFHYPNIRRQPTTRARGTRRASCASCARPLTFT
jgi:hypothetical protein